MNELDESIHQARNQVNDAIDRLAETAMEDSSTYQEAIKKLKDYGWKLVGPMSNVMIDSAIEVVKDKALHSEIEK